MDDKLFLDYFHEWVELEKAGTVRPVTLTKYLETGKWLEKLCPELKIKELDRYRYQRIINAYAETHERVTTKDFHTQLKACITAMFDERIIDRNPALRVTIKGRQTKKKKEKFISLVELNKLIDTLDLTHGITKDWVILLLAKTGIRFAECMGLTPADFDFDNRAISINKTWDYKTNTGFAPTKNSSSVRVIEIDWQITAQLRPLIDGMPDNEPIFVQKGRGIYNSTYNDFMHRKCRQAGIEEISLHGLRHTHGSILLSQGVSILSVSKRLGHSNVTTTQEVYLHITDELAKKDTQLMMGALAGII